MIRTLFILLILYFSYIGNAFSCIESNKDLDIFMRAKKLTNGYNRLEIFTQKKYSGYYLKGATLELQNELIVDLEINRTLEFSGNYYGIDISISDKYLANAIFYLGYSKISEKEDIFATCILPERFKLSEIKEVSY